VVCRHVTRPRWRSGRRDTTAVAGRGDDAELEVEGSQGGGGHHMS
jgi:hypothetical protein